MIQTLARGASALSFGDLNVFGGAIGAFVGSALRVRRAHVEAAMARAGVEAPADSARGMYRSLGTSMLEVLWLAGRGRSPHRDRDLESLVRWEPSARSALADAKNTGAVFAASHTGNWEIASCAVSARKSLLIVTKHLSVGFVDAFWQSSRARYGVELIGAHGAFARARAQVGAGRAVAMMIDQVPVRRSHAIEIDFLGAPALVDRAPATLAARTGALFIVPVARRLENGMQEVSVLDVIAPPKRASRDWIDEATARATRSLERFVRDNPTEWLWMHRRWNAPREAPNAGLSR